MLEHVHGFPVSRDDEVASTAIYESSSRDGPEIRWDADGGAWIPTYAHLMTQTDRHGR